MNDCSPLGLDPGSKYMGELVGHNVKGAGPGHTFPVYTLKPPEAIESPPAGPPDHQVGWITHTLFSLCFQCKIGTLCCIIGENGKVDSFLKKPTFSANIRRKFNGDVAELYRFKIAGLIGGDILVFMSPLFLYLSK